METAAQYRQVLGGHHRVSGNGTAGRGGAMPGTAWTTIRIGNGSDGHRDGPGWDGQRQAMQATAQPGSDRHGTTFSDGNIAEGHLARNRMAGQRTACRGQAGHGTAARRPQAASGYHRMGMSLAMLGPA